VFSKAFNLTSRSLAKSTSMHHLFGSSKVHETSPLIASYRIKHGRLFRCALPAAGGDARGPRRLDGRRHQPRIDYAAGLHEHRRSQRIHSGRPSGRRSGVFRAADTGEEGRNSAGVPEQDGRLRADRKNPFPVSQTHPKRTRKFANQSPHS